MKRHRLADQTNKLHRANMTSAKMADDAIEAAAKYLTTKIEKQHKKHCKLEQCSKQGHPGYLRLPSLCQCEEEKLQIEKGKKSPMMKSPIADRRSRRRDGVAEMSDMEGRLVRGALEIILKTHGMAEFNLRPEYK